MRTKPGHLNVVAQQVRVLRDFVHLTGEELLLVIETRSPGKITADLKIFPQTVEDHICGADALGRVFIMGAAGRMDMIVA